MKILVVHNAYQSHHIGGEDVVVEREVAALQEALGNDSIFRYQISNDNIRPLKLAFSIWGDRHHAKMIANLVRLHKIDIVHVHNFFPLLTPRFLVEAKKAGAKIVQTLHNFRWWCLSGIFYRSGVGHCEKCVKKCFAWPAVFYRCYRGSRLQSLIGSLAFARYRQKRYQEAIDKYFVLTYFQKEKLKPILAESKMVVKPNLIDQPTKLVAFGEKKHYLFVGRLEEAKGFNLLLELWRQLPQSFQLDVIGADTHENYAHTTTFPNVRLLGKLSHQETLNRMAHAKYVLQPALAYETFGLTIMEAMAQGTPVIGLNIGTRPELIQSDYNGFITTQDKLYDTILQSDKYEGYEKLCQNALETAKIYTAAIVIKKQIALYQEVLEHE